MGCRINTTEPTQMILVSFLLEDNVLSDEIKIRFIFLYHCSENGAFCFLGTPCICCRSVTSYKLAHTNFPECWFTRLVHIHVREFSIAITRGLHHSAKVCERNSRVHGDSGGVNTICSRGCDVMTCRTYYDSFATSKPGGPWFLHSGCYHQTALNTNKMEPPFHTSFKHIQRAIVLLQQHGYISIERWRHAVFQHGRRIVQTDLDIQGSHAHYAHTIIMRLNHERRSSWRNRYAQLCKQMLA